MDGTTLIVGGDSRIGGALLAALRRDGTPVLATSRRKDKVEIDWLHLDLKENLTDWQPPPGVSAAIIAASMTRIETCRRDPVGTARVNVEGVAAAARKLSQAGAFVVFLSTNQVFDGLIPYRRPEDPVSPMTEYGRQKAEAERRIRSLGDSAAIVRFTKILEPSVPLFSQWSAALKAGQAIQPFNDMRIAPVPLSSALAAIQRISQQRRSGIYHVSGTRDISYAEIGYLAAQTVGASPNLVQPVSAYSTRRVHEYIPPHTTLNIDSLRAVPGMAPPPDVEWTVSNSLAKCA